MASPPDSFLRSKQNGRGVAHDAAPDCAIFWLLDRNQINRRIFAATINLNFELKPVTFIKARHASAFNGRNVDESIGLAIIALNKAKALHRVEKFDGARRLFAGQLTLRAAAITAAEAAAIRTITAITWRSAACHRQGFTVDLEIGRGDLATTINQRETERLTIGKPCEAELFDSRNMDEYILAAIIAHDKAEALLCVEEFYNAGAFADNLCGHRRAARRTAATKAATTTTAEAIAAATAETVAAAAAAEAITAAKTAAKLLFAKTVPFVSAAPAAIATTPFIETHALNNFPQMSPEY